MTATLALPLAAAVTAALTPTMIVLARRTEFYDRPAGYKGHLRPTPYLGGAAVLTGLLIATIAIGGGQDVVLTILGCAAVLWALGTADDRFGTGLLLRLVVEAAAGAALYLTGLGWSVFATEALNLLLTVVFTVGVINAFNLMDNMDGAMGAVALVSGAFLGMLAVAQGDAALAALGLGLAGACAGFLPFNLSSPSRIFLGDGGSVPVGFVVAATIMAMPGGNKLGLALVPLAVVLVGLPALDTALVIVSRLRRGAGVFTGGRDHLTHRLLTRLGSPRRVAVTLAAAQTFLCGAAVLLFELERSFAAAGALTLITCGAAAVVLLETPEWAPRTAAETST